MYDMVQASPQVIWIAAREQLIKFEPNTQKTRYFTPSKLVDGKASIYKLCKDSEGMIWIGTNHQGLGRFNPTTEKFTFFQQQAQKANSLNHNTVKCMYEDSKGRFWIATGGGGLNLMNREEGTFQHFSEKEGLANNVVYSILEDKAGNLWLSTNEGISKFNPDHQQFVNFNKEDGFINHEFNANAYFKSQSGELFFGGINGIDAFYPENLKKNPQPPVLIFTNVKQQGKNKASLVIRESFS